MSAPFDFAALFVALLHPASVILAMVLPCVRAIIRKCRKTPKCFVLPLVVHDTFSGFAVPSFAALCLSPMLPDITSKLDGHTLQLAGALGIVYTLAEIFGPGHFNT